MNTSDEEKRPREKGARGGLFRRFVLPQIIITGVAGMLALFAAGKAQRALDRERLEDVVASNIRITDELTFPRSGRLASKLSAITGTTVVFSGAQKELISATELTEAQQAAARKAVSESPATIQHLGLDSAAGPLKSEGEYLIILQPQKNLWALASGSSALWPLFGGLFLAIGSAFLISRAVVSPLQKMANQLDEAPPEEVLSMPSRLLDRRDEIGLLARSLVESRQDLLSEQERRRRVEHLALLGELTTSLAHEIKNPASAILMHAQTLEKYGQETTGTLIKEESERIVSLVNQWLFVAKPEAPRLSSYDLVAIVRRLVEKLQPVLDFHAVNLVLESPSELSLNCDSLRVEHVFRNLIDNAIQAMPTGGEVVVKLWQDGDDRIGFSVQDQGTGFSDSALSHFGEAFYSEREGGMGLGLALVKGVVEAHAGEVHVENLSAGGSIVRGHLLTQASSKS